MITRDETRPPRGDWIALLSKTTQERYTPPLVSLRQGNTTTITLRLSTSPTLCLLPSVSSPTNAPVCARRTQWIISYVESIWIDPCVICFNSWLYSTIILLDLPRVSVACITNAIDVCITTSFRLFLYSRYEAGVLSLDCGDGFLYPSSQIKHTCPSSHYQAVGEIKML